MAHCWEGQASRAWQGCSGQGVWGMAIGPVWEALIHTTSCHLPPLPACSPSAAAWLLSLLMSIFRAGWFLPSKTGKCVVEQQGVCFFCLFVVVVFLRHTIVHRGQLVHTFHTLLPVPVNISDYCTFLYTCIPVHMHPSIFACGSSLFSAPEGDGWVKVLVQN